MLGHAPVRWWRRGTQRRLGQVAAVIVLCVALPFLTAFGSFREPGLLPGNSPDETPFSLAALSRLRAQPAPPAITAHSAIVWDETNKTELYSKAPDDRVAPASTTKMLTALLTIELVPLTTVVTIEAGDLNQPDESSMGLQVGDVVTVESLLYGILLPSGGDAANAAARVTGAALLAGAPGDPVARFVQEMNARVAKWGLANTHFVNPHGDDAPGQYSSARDLLRIASEALGNTVFAKIVATPQLTVRTVNGSRTFNLLNTNALLTQRPGVHGVKTGTTPAAGDCLITAQWGPGGRILAVVMGSAHDQRFSDTTILLDWVNAAYRWVSLGQDARLPGLAMALARWGVEFHGNQVAVLQTWEVPSLRYQLLLGAGSGKDGERGQVVFSTATRQVLSLPVYAKPAPKSSGGSALTVLVKP
ncbi:MAG: D-alanyl-D-alanine carboxypeptidase family protein [Thermomicrobiales bacterium]